MTNPDPIALHMSCMKILQDLFRFIRRGTNGSECDIEFENMLKYFNIRTFFKR